MSASAKYLIAQLLHLNRAKLTFSAAIGLFLVNAVSLTAQESILDSKPIPNAKEYKKRIAADALPARIATGQTVDGVIEGQLVYTTDDGLKLMTEEYLHGELHGISISYYPNGKKQAETNYVSGEQHGESKKYWPNGKLFFQGNFEHGQPHGRQRSYFDNGKLSVDAQAETGLYQGERKHYTTQGIQFGISIWEDGIQIDGRQTGELDQRESDAMRRRLMFPDLVSLWAERSLLRK